MIFILVIVLIMFFTLLLEVGNPSIIVFAVLTIFLITGILTLDEALSGFSNEGMLTVALLFIVAGAIQKSGFIEKIMNTRLTRSNSLIGTMVRFFVPISAFSAFLNNTPIVVTLTPILKNGVRIMRLHLQRC